MLLTIECWQILAILYTNLNMALVKYILTLKSHVFYIMNFSFKEIVDFENRFLISIKSELATSYLC